MTRKKLIVKINTKKWCISILSFVYVLIISGTSTMTDYNTFISCVFSFHIQ